MKYYSDYSDQRLKDGCVYCHGIPDTRDHIPSKVFLDKPYPSNLMVVPACEECNHQFSLDEQYVAFFIEYLRSMDLGIDFEENTKLNRMLEQTPSLEERLLSSIGTEEDGEVYIKPEHDRIKKVILKHAFGHVYFELGESLYKDPVICTYKPVYLMSKEQMADFNTDHVGGYFAEVGSRLMQRQALQGNGWINVQDGKYRYHVIPSPKITVRMVFGEFLYCEAIWE